MNDIKRKPNYPPKLKGEFKARFLVYCWSNILAPTAIIPYSWEQNNVEFIEKSLKNPSAIETL